MIIKNFINAIKVSLLDASKWTQWRRSLHLLFHNNIKKFKKIICEIQKISLNSASFTQSYYDYEIAYSEASIQHFMNIIKKIQSKK